MTTCRVRYCDNEPLDMIDLDPDKLGGWTSLPMQVPVCADHLAELKDPTTQWVCDNFAGDGPEVLIGEHLADLDERYLVPESSIESSNSYRRQSADIPDRYHVRLTTQKLGTNEESEVSFHASRDELADLMKTLRYIVRDE